MNKYEDQFFRNSAIHFSLPFIIASNYLTYILTSLFFQAYEIHTYAHTHKIIKTSRKISNELSELKFE